MAKAKKMSSCGRSQDRKRVAGGGPCTFRHRSNVNRGGSAEWCKRLANLLRVSVSSWS
jgi:hypothetical protein